MLTLPIKKQWYDMILSSIKKEEYRNITPYYTSRFTHAKEKEYPFRICFRNGYSSSSPSFIATCSLRIGRGKQEWGAAPSTEYYVLTILSIEK